MNRELYDKMTDDERLQYIRNLQDCREAFGNVLFSQNERIELLQRLINANECFAHCESIKVEANERYYDYKDKLLTKYDLQPIPTCEGKPIG